MQGDDVQWMKLALDEGRRGLGTTSPNPPVGAVVVAEGRAIGFGYHRRAGEAHAERRALADACERGHASLLAGATLYVTLEPCSSYGRTPPCTEAIVEAGLARVVYGTDDPDPRHRGRARRVLAEHGIACEGGVCATECRYLARGFLSGVERKRPWVTAKIAMTLDGRLTRCKERWLSSGPALRYAHQLRLESDAILVGGETVRCDDPALTVREPLTPIPDIKRQPWRVVATCDRSSLPPDARLLTDAFSDRTLVFERVEDWKEDLLARLYEERGVRMLLLECGGRLLRSWLAEGLVDEWVGIHTPWIAGGPSLAVSGPNFLPREWRLARPEVIQLDRDVVIRGLLEQTAQP